MARHRKRWTWRTWPNAFRQLIAGWVLRDEDAVAIRRDALREAADLRRQGDFARLEDTRYFLHELSRLTGPRGVRDKEQ